MEETILAILRRTTDGVEDLEIDTAASIAVFDGLLKAALDLLGLLFEHRGLISHSDPAEMQLRVKTSRACAGRAKAVQESLAISAIADVITDVIDIRQS